MRAYPTYCCIVLTIFVACLAFYPGSTVKAIESTSREMAASSLSNVRKRNEMTTIPTLKNEKILTTSIGKKPIKAKDIGEKYSGIHTENYINVDVTTSMDSTSTTIIKLPSILKDTLNDKTFLKSTTIKQNVAIPTTATTLNGGTYTIWSQKPTTTTSVVTSALSKILQQKIPTISVTEATLIKDMENGKALAAFSPSLSTSMGQVNEQTEGRESILISTEFKSPSLIKESEQLSEPEAKEQNIAPISVGTSSSTISSTRKPSVTTLAPSLVRSYTVSSGTELPPETFINRKFIKQKNNDTPIFSAISTTLKGLNEVSTSSTTPIVMLTAQIAKAEIPKHYSLPPVKLTATKMPIIANEKHAINNVGLKGLDFDNTHQHETQFQSPEGTLITEASDFAKESQQQVMMSTHSESEQLHSKSGFELKINTSTLRIPLKEFYPQKQQKSNLKHHQRLATLQNVIKPEKANPVTTLPTLSSISLPSLSFDMLSSANVAALVGKKDDSVAAAADVNLIIGNENMQENELHIQEVDKKEKFSSALASSSSSSSSLSFSSSPKSLSNHLKNNLTSSHRLRQTSLRKFNTIPSSSIQANKYATSLPINGINSSASSLSLSSLSMGASLSASSSLSLSSSTPSLSISYTTPSMPTTRQTTTKKRRPVPTTTLKPPPTIDDYQTITSQAGTHTYLPCNVKQLVKKPISWLRKRDGHILTVDQTTFIADQRFQSIYSANPERWSLQIKYVQPKDEGTYECQVSTEPKASAIVTLHVIEPKTDIIGEATRHVKAGSEVKLHCIISQALEPPIFINWFFNQKQIYLHNRKGWRTEIERIELPPEMLTIRTTTTTTTTTTPKPSTTIKPLTLLSTAIPLDGNGITISSTSAASTMNTGTTITASMQSASPSLNAEQTLPGSISQNSIDSHSNAGNGGKSDATSATGKENILPTNSLKNETKMNIGIDNKLITNHILGGKDGEIGSDGNRKLSTITLDNSMETTTNTESFLLEALTTTTISPPFYDIRHITTASLIIRSVGKQDSGNYTCSPSNSAPRTVVLHVLNGEYSASAITSGIGSNFLLFSNHRKYGKWSLNVHCFNITIIWILFWIIKFLAQQNICQFSFRTDLIKYDNCKQFYKLNNHNDSNKNKKKYVTTNNDNISKDMNNINRTNSSPGQTTNIFSSLNETVPIVKANTRNNLSYQTFNRNGMQMLGETSKKNQNNNQWRLKGSIRINRNWENDAVKAMPTQYEHAKNFKN